MTDPLLSQSATLNPYRRGAALFAERLKWDLDVESWRSRARLRRLRDTHAGEKAVILCNGPSLNRVDFDALRGVYCFGLNKINLLFDKSAFRPDCIVSVNPFVIEQNADYFNHTEIPLFLARCGRRHVRTREKVTFLHSSSVPKFARDVSVSLYESGTVTFVALQIAFHMGFREVALVGADHNFATKGPAGALVGSGDRDESHFDPRYFSGGMQWQLPALFDSEVGYTMARDVYAAFGGRVVNATDGGQLEVFERQSLGDYLGAGGAENRP